MLIEQYFGEIEHDINSCPFIHSYNLVKDKRSLHIGFIEGSIRFIDNSTLYFMEFVDVSEKVEKYKYSYHHEDDNSVMIFRYDMAPHFRDIETFPHHKHEGNKKVIASKEPSLKEILYEIEKLILQ
ncbi:MAG: hypothetical protein FJ241_11175 [Nitrospira sp.]|nr:hypothetical protein [Nitrospira sp.]